MAINKISGNILQDNLQRSANLSVQGNLVYFDVVNNRVGVLTSTPSDDFEISGTFNSTDVRIDSITPKAILYAGDDNLVKSDANFSFDGSVLNIDNVVVDQQANIGNFVISNSTIGTQDSNNIRLSPDNNSQLIIDTTSGVVLPTGDTSERPDNPQRGTIRFNSNLNIVEVFDGAVWEGVGEDLSLISIQVIVGDNSTTSFTLDKEASAESILVSINGVVQSPLVSYTVTNDTTINFVEAPLDSDVVDIRFIAELTVVTAISNSTGNSAITVEQNGVANLSTVQSLQLPSYNTAQANLLPNVRDGQLIYCTDGNSGSPCLAVYSIDGWKIVNLGGNIAS